MIPPPINIPKWIEENGHKLKPPVNNFVIQRGNFQVMLVGGPNERLDYHVNETEEWFYQYKGKMLLKVVDDGVFKDIYIEEGCTFLLPPNVPHNPVRFADTIGIVIERMRDSSNIDRLRWYCHGCKEIVHERSFNCTDLGTQLKPIIEEYASNEKLRICAKCGYANPAKP